MEYHFQMLINCSSFMIWHLQTNILDTHNVVRKEFFFSFLVNVGAFKKWSMHVKCSLFTFI